MKKIISTVILLSLSIFGLVSCSMNEDSGGLSDKWIGMGVVHVVTNGAVDQILLDNGDLLRVTSNMIPQYKMTVGDRLLINYDILSTLGAENSRKGYNIRLNTAREILCKPTIRESFLRKDEKPRNDSIGRDPIEVEYAWFGGDFLNLNLEILRSDPQLAHMVTLVWDDLKSDKTTAYLSLRHNAFGDPQRHTSYGCISFEISSLIPAGASQIDIVLSWENPAGETKSIKGIFKPYAFAAANYAGISSSDYTALK